MLKFLFIATSKIKERIFNEIKMNMLKIKTFLLIFYLFPFLGIKIINAETSQKFEGLIKIVEYNEVDTLIYEFKVKDNFVAIWMHNNQKSTNKYFIADTTKKEIYEINKEQKVYIKYAIENPPEKKEDKEFIKIEKTDNYKIIDGIQCFQWLVINKVKNTVLSYWVAKQDFSFLYDIIYNIKSASNKRTSYFMFIPNYEMFFPYQSIERGLLREFRGEEQLVYVKPQKLSDSIFKIPEGYIEIH